MYRTFHPARVLRYLTYFAVLSTGAITIYTLFTFMFERQPDLRTRSVNIKTVPVELRPLDSLLRYIGDHLSVKYELLDHVDYRSRSRVTFTNSGDRDIRPGNWTLFFFLMSPIDTDMYNYGSEMRPWFRMYRVQGNLYRLAPTNYFTVLRPTADITLELTSGTWILAFTDVLPNWYVWSPGLEGRVLRDTAARADGFPRFIQPFPDGAKTRHESDPQTPFTPAQRYEKNRAEFTGSLRRVVVPTPLSIASQGIGEAEVVIGKDWVVVALADLSYEASCLKDKLGISLATRRPTSRYIELTIGTVTFPDPALHKHKQGYSLDVDADTEVISVVAQTPAGAFYAVQTLLALYAADTRTLPAVRVLDAPRLPFRGIMIDLARNFHSDKTEIIRVLEALSTYKMNKLHLHLADDEGWRLEIPGLPELTTVGAHRCHDPTELTCILPALGSGPSVNTSGSGFLSTDDYREILKYANQRHIQIIPEFDMPGHGRAAIRSMEARYKHLSLAGKHEAAKEFLLSDLTDQSRYMSGQFFTDNAINPCIESTYHFVEHLMVQVQKLHADINPLTHFHFGGDEVPGSAFMESVSCQSYMSSHPELQDTRDLKIHFIRRIAAIAAEHHLGVQGWEDSFYGKDVLPMRMHDLYAQKNVITDVWLNMWEGGMGHRAYELANHGYKVVISHATHLYLDHVQEPDPEERGLFWSVRYTDTRHIFGFIPGDIYANIDQRGLGEPWSREEACGDVVNCVPLEKPENVIGIQGSMWGETVLTRSHQNYMLFPRVLALAERGWHLAEWESEPDLAIRRALRQPDWARFAHVVGHRELRRLEEIGIHYRLPPPGVIKENGRFVVNTEFPGLVVQYSQDLGYSWRDWSPGVKPRGDIWLASRSFDGKRRSRIIKVRIPTDLFEEIAVDPRLFETGQEPKRPKDLVYLGNTTPKHGRTTTVGS